VFTKHVFQETTMPLDATTAHGDDPFERYNTPNSPILFPVGERKVGWQMRSGNYAAIPTHKAIIRMTQDGSAAHVLNVVGNNYRLVHNKELFTNVEDVLRKKMQGSALRDVQVTDKVSGWGRVCLREYVFPNIVCKLTRGARSSIAFRLIVQNGYGGSALRLHAGGIEFYCSNGMISGDYQSTYHKHTSGLVVAGVGASVENALQAFAHNQLKWQHWADTPVKYQEAMELFRQLASSEKLSENLAQQYMRETDQRGSNLWAVYSAMTYYASHTDGEFKLRESVVAQDSQASTMLQRELNVAKWIQSRHWKALERCE
jgi:hypothetical protein